MNISSKELKKMTRNQLSGKYGTFIGTNVLYILITLVASNLMDLVLGTSSILNPLTFRILIRFRILIASAKTIFPPTSA